MLSRYFGINPASLGEHTINSIAMGCESQATLPGEVQERSVEHANMGAGADQSSGTRACDNVAPIRRDANAMVEELVRGRNRKQTVLRFISDI